MLKHLEGAKLGLFIFIGTVLLVIAIFFVGSKDSLFTNNIHIKAFFDNVEGLRSGAAVRLNGLNVGSVSDIKLMQREQYRVEVTLRINKSVKDFIRLDSKAAIETEGIIGSKIVIITPGTDVNPAIEDGGIIMSQTPVNMTQIIAETQNIMAYMKDLTKEFADVFQKVNKGEGTIGKLVNDDELYFEVIKIVQSADTSLVTMVNRLDRMTGFIIGLGSGIEDIVKNVDSAAIDIRNLASRIENGEGALGALIADESVYDSIKSIVSNLTKTTTATKEGTQSFAENMEALKHNWLFKGYFEERGYWDKEDYEKELDQKIKELYRQQEILELRLKELNRIEKILSN